MADKAFNGKAANTTLDEMKLAANTFKPDYLGDIRGPLRGYADAISNLMPSGTGPDGKPIAQTSDNILNAFIDLQKNQGTVLRDALKTTYSRITNLDMISTAKTLPSANTPQGALVINASQMQGANDYNDAMNELLVRYRADPNNKLSRTKFISSVNQVLTPDIFMFQRYPADVQQQVIANLKNMPDGDKRIKSLMNQRAYIVRNGLTGIGQVQPQQSQQQ